MIDDDLDKKIRNLQAKMIQKESKAVSFSHALSLVLTDALKRS